ncbi:MAG: SAM-dependent chlorinase/fluorinase [Deltaproteobacteria bacterium]|nr:SAM-dependent chlorinase/fluorinase [Deltaproteobacteria bacterium]
MPALVTLTTDFGLSDPFVGVMKGVILARLPEATIVDLTHGIPPQDLMAGCFWLSVSHGAFPAGTVHVAVVDPGVGTARRALVARAGGHLFVAPDNGLLGPLLHDPASELRTIAPETLQRLGLSRSATFDGRDVFAPVGAELAAGRLRLEDVGPEARPVVSSALPPARISPQKVVGVVAVIDRFGNIISNIPAAALTMAHLEAPLVCVGKQQLGLSRTYGEAGPMEYLALINSFGHVEVARASGDAASALGVISGTAVVVVETPPQGTN